MAMWVRVLGAHNLETPTTRMTSLLVDGVLALDAGAITSALSLEEQASLHYLLLTHRHYDHIRDVPVLGLNTLTCGTTLPIYGPGDTLEHLRARLMDGALYPDFTRRPSPEAPRFRLVEVQAGQEVALGPYRAIPLPMHHTVPAVGYLLAGPEGRRLLYTGDTGPGLARTLEETAPDLLVTEVTLPNRLEAPALEAGHLTPALLQRELEPLARLKPGARVVVLHMAPTLEGEIGEELRAVERALGLRVLPATEGMLVQV